MDKMRCKNGRAKKKKQRSTEKMVIKNRAERKKQKEKTKTHIGK